MADVINLRLARKAKDRASAQLKASVNRAKFGPTAGEKARDQIERDRTARTVDGAFRDTDA